MRTQGIPAERLRLFLRDMRGSLTVEAVIMFPMLFWAFTAMLVFFDAYRQSGIHLKAAYTISDMISRETDAINNAYLDGAHGLFKQLSRSSDTARLRVSVIYWDAAAQEYRTDWSHQRGGAAVLTDADLKTMLDRLPVLPPDERLILVDTWSGYKPPFNVGINQKDMHKFIFTRPRFAPQVKFES